jgi:hypothetical protein
MSAKDPGFVRREALAIAYDYFEANQVALDHSSILDRVESKIQEWGLTPPSAKQNGATPSDGESDRDTEEKNPGTQSKPPLGRTVSQNSGSSGKRRKMTPEESLKAAEAFLPDDVLEQLESR